jgi:hypothetical protein
LHVACGDYDPRPEVGGGGITVAVTICVKRVDATLENGIRSCPDQRLQRYLQATSSECRRIYGPVAEQIEALHVSNRVGGAVLPEVAPAAPVSPPRSG